MTKYNITIPITNIPNPKIKIPKYINKSPLKKSNLDLFFSLISSLTLTSEFTIVGLVSFLVLCLIVCF